MKFLSIARPAGQREDLTPLVETRNKNTTARDTTDMNITNSTGVSCEGVAAFSFAPLTDCLPEVQQQVPKPWSFRKVDQTSIKQ